MLFRIGLHSKDLPLLEKIQSFFQHKGQIYKSGDTVRFNISSIKELSRIIQHFDKYPLITQKLADYLLFKKVYLMVLNKEPLTLNGLQDIIAIRCVLNKGLPEGLKEKFSDVKPAVRPEISLPSSINPFWFAGFTSADGSFSVKVLKNLSTKIGSQVLLNFKITQHIKDKLLLESFINYFNLSRSPKGIRTSPVLVMPYEGMW